MKSKVAGQRPQVGDGTGAGNDDRIQLDWYLSPWDTHRIRGHGTHCSTDIRPGRRLSAWRRRYPTFAHGLAPHRRTARHDLLDRGQLYPRGAQRDLALHARLAHE